MTLEGIGVRAGGLITRLNPKGDDLPLVLTARLSDQTEVAYCSDELPLEVQQALVAVVAQFRFPEAAPIQYLLRAHGIQSKAGHYKTYIFPQNYMRVIPEGVKRFHKTDPLVRAFGFDGLADTVYAVEKDGAILSACVSARQNDECAEAWVYTDPKHRDQGLGRSVVTAWAHAVMRDGLTPFYSHAFENTASAHLARRLELIPMFEEIAVERNG